MENRDIQQDLIDSVSGDIPENPTLAGMNIIKIDMRYILGYMPKTLLEICDPKHLYKEEEESYDPYYLGEERESWDDS